MPKPEESEREYWSELGNPSKAEREWLTQRLFLEDYLIAKDRQLELDSAREELAAIRRFAVAARPADSLEARQDEDGRWSLLADLGVRKADRGGGANLILSPLWIRCETRSASPMDSERIVLDFDSRLSLAAVIRALRELWPQMSAKGWTRRTRPLGERSLALIRHVCLECEPDAGWPQRLASWNRTHPQWLYEAETEALAWYAMQKDYRRAERSLAGERGLEWFLTEANRPETRTAAEIVESTIAADRVRRAGYTQANGGEGGGGNG